MRRPTLQAREISRSCYKLLAERRNEEALSLLEDLVARDRSGSSHALLGDALFALERYAEAADSYATALDEGFAGEDDVQHLREKLEAARTNAFVGAEHETLTFAPPAVITVQADPPSSARFSNTAELSRPSLLDRLLRMPGAGRLLADDPDRVWTAWYHKPRALAILKLAQMRAALNRFSIFDTYRRGERPEVARARPENAETVRQIDGSYNDLLADPAMGAAGVRFGRNVPLEKARPDEDALLSPNPREVSRHLMTRDEFRPVPFLNLIAASWIQFMTHDWFSHGAVSGNGRQKLVEIPLAKDDPLRHKHHTTTMFVPASPSDPSRHDDEEDLPPTHLNEVTHWWDASQVYGSDRLTADKLRSFSGGKLALAEDGRLPLDRLGIEVTGFKRNWWVGLSIARSGSTFGNG